MAATGFLGEQIQHEAFESMAEKEAVIRLFNENKAAIAEALLTTLAEYPERIAELDPLALRNLAGFVGEAALPATAVSRLNKVK